MNLIHIAAVDPNMTIGNKGGIPWKIPDEMKFFRDLTWGEVVIMGRKTYESIGHPLARRHNMVMTTDPTFKSSGAVVLPSLKDALHEISRFNKVYCIGGAQLYKVLMPFVDTVILSHIKEQYAGDVQFPCWKDIEEGFKETEVLLEREAFKAVKYQRLPLNCIYD